MKNDRLGRNPFQSSQGAGTQPAHTPIVQETKPEPQPEARQETRREQPKRAPRQEQPKQGPKAPPYYGPDLKTLAEEGIKFMLTEGVAVGYIVGIKAYSMAMSFIQKQTKK